MLNSWLQAIFPWLAAVLMISWAYPWARIILTTLDVIPRRDPVLVGLVTTTLSLGGLAWWGMALAAISPALVNFWAFTLPVTILHGIGWAVLQRQPKRVDDQPAHDPSWAWHPIRLTMIALMVLLVALTLFNAAYWPIVEDDAISLYAPRGYTIATTGLYSLDDNLYNAYPVLNDTLMAYAQLANGVFGPNAPHEYISRLLMAVLATGSIAAVYVLGRDLYNRDVGLVAAFLLAAVRLFTHWAAAAYNDIPAGTYFLLAAIFAWRLAHKPHWLHALLTGLVAGLAAYTKNGALLLPGSLLGWFIYSIWQHWIAKHQQQTPAYAPIRWQHGLLMVIGWLVVAGPWYTATWLQFDYLIPPTGWTHLADHSLRMLFGLAFTWSQYGLGGLVGMIAIGHQLILLWRSRWSFAPATVLLLGFGVPFWLVWWWLFSYELRFLLMVLGFFMIMGAKLLVDLGRWITPRLPQYGQAAANIAIPVILVILMIPALRTSVDHKGDMLRDPFMDGDARHHVQLGGRWDVIQWFRTALSDGTISPEDRLIVSGIFSPFHLRQLPAEIAWAAHDDQAAVLQAGYWVPWPNTEPPVWAADFDVVYTTDDGYVIYAVNPTNEE